MAPMIEEVEFKTLDQLTLRGDLYAARARGPAVIITPGVSRNSIIAFNNINARTYDRRARLIDPNNCSSIASKKCLYRMLRQVCKKQILLH